MADCIKPINGDLDPLFLKALKIMQSNKPTAADDLFHLYEEICRQKRGEVKIEAGDINKNKKVFPKKEGFDAKRKDNSDDNLLEKNKMDSKQLETAAGQTKELDTSSDDDDDDDDTITNKNVTSKDGVSNTKKRKVSSDSDTEISDLDTNENELDDLRIDLDIVSLSCVICKTLSQTNNNKLVECQECHNLYHQECHKPPITENVNDPRFVWYCTKCAKNMKKIACKVVTKKPKLSTSPLPGAANNLPRNSPTPFTKAATIEMKQNAVSLSSHAIQQPFKRTDSLKAAVSKESNATPARPPTSSIPVPSKDAAAKNKPGVDQMKNPLVKLGKSVSVDKQSMKDNSNSSSSSGSNSNGSKVIEAKGHGVQKMASKNVPSFLSAIGASASASSLTFSGSIARLNNENPKKTINSKISDKK